MINSDFPERPQLIVLRALALAGPCTFETMHDLITTAGYDMPVSTARNALSVLRRVDGVSVDKSVRPHLYRRPGYPVIEKNRRPLGGAA